MPVALAEPRPAGRFAALDAARGVALAAMVVFHAAFDLDSLGLATLHVDSAPGWRWFARLIAGSFLALSGVSLVIAQGNGIRWGAYLRRLAILVGAAALVTLATWWAMPEEFIFFGILHAIAAASIVGLAFLRTPWLVTLVAAVLALIAPQYLVSAPLDTPLLRWLGLGATLPATLDYEPVFPWVAPFLLGMAMTQLTAGGFAASAAGRWKPTRAPGRLLAWAGRHSLAIYLIHQPLMYGTLSLIALATTATVRGSAEDRPFIDACQSTCLLRNGGDKAYCTRYCACTAGELKKAGLWEGVLADRLSAEEHDRLASAMRICAVSRPAGGQP